MIWKLAVLILVGALGAASLLSVRQQRVQAAHELTESIRRKAELDRTLLRMRLRVAEKATPANARQIASALGPLEPVLREWCPTPQFLGVYATIEPTLPDYPSPNLATTHLMRSDRRP